MAVFLKPDKTRKERIGNETLVIHEKLIPDDMRAPRNVALWVKKGQLMKPNAPLGGNGRPRGICVHNTNDIQVARGTNAAEQYTRATFNGNMAGVVVHFYVWKNEIWQNLRLDERGWHAADGSSRRAGRRPGQKIGGNLDTIAIEAIGPHEQTTETTAKLCAWLCKNCDLDPTLDLWQHNDFAPRSGCPKYILRTGWTQFLQAVQGFYRCVGPVADEVLNAAQVVVQTVAQAPPVATQVVTQSAPQAATAMQARQSMVNTASPAFLAGQTLRQRVREKLKRKASRLR